MRNNHTSQGLASMSRQGRISAPGLKELVHIDLSSQLQLGNIPGATQSTSNLTQSESHRNILTYKYLTPRGQSSIQSQQNDVQFVFASKHFPPIEQVPSEQETAIVNAKTVKQSRLPKKLTMELNKISKFFVTELNGEESTDIDSTRSKKNFQQSNNESSPSNAYQMKYYASDMIKFNTRQNSSTASLLARKKSLQAIESYQSASRKLKTLMKDQDEENKNSLQTQIKRNGTPEKEIQLSIPMPKSSFSYGFSQIKDLKGYLTLDQQSQQMTLLTDARSPSLVNSTKNLNSKSLHTTTIKKNVNIIDQERRIIEAIDGSKFCQERVEVMEQGVSEGQRKWNELNYLIIEKDNRMIKMKEEYESLGVEEMQKAKEANEEILELDRQIKELDELIYDQERKYETLSFMKGQRSKDLFFNTKPLMVHFSVIHHLNRFLSKQTEDLHVDSKQLNKIFIEMIEKARQKQRSEELQKVHSQILSNKVKKEEEAERLAEFESGMRDIARNNERNERKQRAEEIRQKKQEEERRKNALTFQLQEQIDSFNDQFLEFHHSHPVVSSYHDLLNFCIHVKENTQDLKEEWNQYKQLQSELSTEVKNLQAELSSLKYSSQTKTDTLIIEHNLNRKKEPHAYGREDDFIDIENLEKQHTIEEHELEMLGNTVSKKSKHEQSILTLLNGIHSRLSVEIKKGPQQHQNRVGLKNFDVNNIEDSIKGLSFSLKQMNDILIDNDIGNERSMKYNYQQRKTSISAEDQFNLLSTVPAQMTESVIQDSKNSTLLSPNMPRKYSKKQFEFPLNTNTTDISRTLGKK